MKTIDIITIQSKEILSMIMKNKIYYSTAKNYVYTKKPNLQKPYEYMMQVYGYKHYPIFGCPVGYYANFVGAKLDSNTVILQLRVPITEVRFQKYYDWSDMIYFTECPNEWNYPQDANIPFEEYCNNTLLNTNLDNIGNNYCQATMEKIDKDWIIDILEPKLINDEYDVLNNYINNYFPYFDKNNILKSLKDIKNNLTV